MTRSNPVAWLGRQARRGLTDLPRNIVWVLDETVKNPAASAGHTVQSAGRKAAATLADANPFTGGRSDGVDAAMERAHELETRAHDEATQAKEREDAARAVEAEGDRQVAAARDEGDRETAEVVAEAQREADAYVAAKRARAEELAARHVAETEAEAAKQREQAQNQADKARERAEQAIERARQQMKQARELAEEAAEAARQAADEARARAERLAGDAEAEADKARRKADVADERQKAASSDGGLGSDGDIDPRDLDDMTKDRLIALGTEMDLDLKASMRKDALVSAIREHAAGHGQEARAS